MKHILFAALLAQSAAPLAAQTRQFADVIYPAPEGWTAGRERDGSKVFLSDLPGDRCTSCRFYLSGSEKQAGGLADYIAANLTRFESADERGKFAPMGQPRDLTLAGHPARLESYVFGKRTIYIFAALDLGARKALLTYRGKFDDAEEAQDVLGVFGDEVAPYFNTLRYSSGPGDTALPEAQPGEMSGVWWGWTQGMTLGLDGMARTTLRQGALVFYPDGHVYAGAPPDGVSKMNRDAALERFDTHLGVYRHIGEDRLQLTFLDGRAMELERAPGGWSDGALTYARAAILPDGARLSGHVAEFSYAALDGGGVARSRSLSFTPDGRFDGERIGSATAGAFFAQSRRAPERGRYEIRDGLLLMTDRAGAVAAELVFETEGRILIGDLLFEGDVE